MTMWTCSCGRQGNTGKFCPECGQQQPQPDWVCSCGNTVPSEAKFCTSCGSPRPTGATISHPVKTEPPTGEMALLPYAFHRDEGPLEDNGFRIDSIVPLPYVPTIRMKTGDGRTIYLTEEWGNFFQPLEYWTSRDPALILSETFTLEPQREAGGLPVIRDLARNTIWWYEWDNHCVFRNDRQFYLEYAGEQQGEILELGSGCGRLTTRFAEAGYHVTAIEESARLVASLRSNKRHILEKITIVEGSIAKFDFDKKFAMIIAPYQEFQYLINDDDIESALACIVGSLADDGIFILDMVDTALALKNQLDPRYKDWMLQMHTTPWAHKDPKNGFIVTKTGRDHRIESVRSRLLDDEVTQVTLSFLYNLTPLQEDGSRGEGTPIEIKADLVQRVYDAASLRLLLERAGLEVIEECSRYDRSRAIDEHQFTFVCRLSRKENQEGCCQDEDDHISEKQSSAEEHQLAAQEHRTATEEHQADAEPKRPVMEAISSDSFELPYAEAISERYERVWAERRFGTSEPVPFRYKDTWLDLDLDVGVKCHGVFRCRIIDPILFIRFVSQSTSSSMRADPIDERIVSEFIAALSPAFAIMSAHGIAFSALRDHTTEFTAALNEVLAASWRDTRGLIVEEASLVAIVLDPKDEEIIRQHRNEWLIKNGPSMRIDRAWDESDYGHPMYGGQNTPIGGLSNPLPDSSTRQNGDQQADGWACYCGRKGITSKFCPECGEPKPS